MMQIERNGSVAAVTNATVTLAPSLDCYYSINPCRSGDRCN